MATLNSGRRSFIKSAVAGATRRNQKPAAKCGEYPPVNTVDSALCHIYSVSVPNAFGGVLYRHLNFRIAVLFAVANTKNRRMCHIFIMCDCLFYISTECEGFKELY